MRFPTFAFRPRTIVIAMAVIIVLAAAAVWYAVSQDQRPGRVDLTSLSVDSTATVGLAGVFPAEEDDPLANPLGIAWDGEVLYVAASDSAT